MFSFSALRQPIGPIPKQIRTQQKNHVRFVTKRKPKGLSKFLCCKITNLFNRYATYPESFNILYLLLERIMGGFKNSQYKSYVPRHETYVPRHETYVPCLGT